MAVMLAAFSTGISWIQSLVKVDRKGKKYRYIIFPIGNSIVVYLLISFIRYVVLEESILSMNFETVLYAVMTGIFAVVSAKIDDVSPRDRKKEPTKPLKYYIDKFIINATPFHKVMLFIYGFIILLLISMILLSFLAI